MQSNTDSNLHRNSDPGWFNCAPEEIIAPQACLACKKRKGKCDRTRPSCSFCQSKGSLCQYSDHPSLPQTQIQRPNFPSVYFLDQELFNTSPVIFPPVGYHVPEYVRAEIGDVAQCRLLATHFFTTIHSWMPIVAKRQFFNKMVNPFAFPHSDVALLCLGIKLILSLPSAWDNPKCPQTYSAYLAARRFLHGPEISTSLTLPTLQAAIFIALYEVGHGIYPAAHLSVNYCVQYAIAMGLGWDASSSQDEVPWIEVEERRRVWWAVVILERYIYLRWHKQSITSAAPTADALLPCNDASWDEGIEAPNYAMTSSSSANLNMNAFALLAQATYLLDRVMRHVKVTNKSAQDQEEEAIYLDQALRSLATFTATETSRRSIKICCYTALCHSAMALLHRPFLGTAAAPNISDSRSQIANNSMDKVALEFLDESHRIMTGGESVLLVTSPLILHWGYEASLRFAQLMQIESTDKRQKEAHIALQKIQAAMGELDSRWKAAGAYLDILKGYQIMSSTPS